MRKYDTTKHAFPPMWHRVLHSEKGDFGITALVLASMAYAGSSAYSSAQEKKSAKDATNAQKEIAQKNIDATLESERLADSTARSQLKLKQARKSQTILTDPNDLEDINTNLSGALGVG